MAELLSVRATIAKIMERYSLTPVMKEIGRSRLLLDKRAASVVEAKAVAASFAALHRIPRGEVEVLYR
jgi:hypothetical protein